MVLRANVSAGPAWGRHPLAAHLLHVHKPPSTLHQIPCRRHFYGKVGKARLRPRHDDTSARSSWEVPPPPPPRIRPSGGPLRPVLRFSFLESSLQSLESKSLPRHGICFLSPSPFSFNINIIFEMSWQTWHCHMPYFHNLQQKESLTWVTWCFFLALLPCFLSFKALFLAFFSSRPISLQLEKRHPAHELFRLCWCHPAQQFHEAPSHLLGDTCRTNRQKAGKPAGKPWMWKA